MPPAINMDGLLIHARGKVDSDFSVTIISDFNCPVCRHGYPQVENLFQKYHDRVRFEAVSLSASATDAIRLSECAGKQGRFWDVYKALFTVNPPLVDISAVVKSLEVDREQCLECVKSERMNSEIMRSMQRLRLLGIDMTPTILINHRIYYGAIESVAIGKRIDELLSERREN